MKLDWRLAVLYISVLGMESCWLYIFIFTINTRVLESVLSVFGLILLYPISFAFHKLLHLLKWKTILLWAISSVVWIIAMLLMLKLQLYNSVLFSDPVWLRSISEAWRQIFDVFRPELFIFIGSLVIWWMGSRISQTKMTFTTTAAEFQFGILLMAIFFIIAWALDVTLGSSILVAVLFFVFALLSLSIAHTSEGKRWFSRLSKGHWLGILLLSIVLVIAVGILIGSIITPDLLQVIVGALKRAWEVVWGGIVWLLTWLVSLFPDPEPLPSPAEPQPPIDYPPTSTWLQIPEIVRKIGRIAWTTVMAGIILFAFWRVSSQIIRWLSRLFANTQGGEIRPLKGAFQADLLALFTLIREKLKNLFGKVRMKSVSCVNPEALTVKSIYSQLLRWAAKKGYPRRIAQTPFEFLDILKNVLPDTILELEFVTQQYVDVRYGARLPTHADLDQLRDCWYRIKRSRINKQV